MTDDFIVDLKYYIRTEHKNPRDAWCDPDDVQAALDEIERLRAALFQIAHQKYGSQMSCVDNYNALQTAARAALEGEKTND
jgi:hypothetical protein